MRGTTVKLFVDGAERISATDSSISAAGRAMVATYSSNASTGHHWDSIVARDDRRRWESVRRVGGAHHPHVYE